MSKTVKNFFKLEMLILKILSQQNCYGYQISQILQSLSDNNINLAEGTLYPIFYRLVDSGYIEDHKIFVGKRKVRVYYSITDAGKAYLDEIYNDYQQMIIYIDKIMSWDKKEEIK